MYLRIAMILALAVSLVLGTTGAAQQKPISDPSSDLERTFPSEPVLQPHNPRYQLRVGDTLDISFRITPEFNQTVTVQPDGSFLAILVGVVLGPGCFQKQVAMTLTDILFGDASWDCLGRLWKLSIPLTKPPESTRSEH